MSLIQNRRGLLGLWFSALLALALFAPGTGAAQEVKQIKLTEKHIQGFMAAYEDIAKVYDGAESDKPEDPKVEAQAAAVAKKHGFASLAQYDDVSMNITMIMSGIDPQTKKFTEPPEQIKNEIAALKADKSVPEAEKKEGLTQLEATLKNARPIQFKENIALVLKYFDQLAPLCKNEIRSCDQRIRNDDGVHDHGATPLIMRSAFLSTEAMPAKAFVVGDRIAASFEPTMSSGFGPLLISDQI